MNYHCWTEIGIRGDRTCPELETVIHCQNCAVYVQAGRSLLERTAPETYVREWTQQIAQPRPQQRSDRTHSAAIFRLGREWLALPADCCDRILDPCPIHRLPHRSNAILRGFVNIQGQLLLCVSLHALLNLDAPTSDRTNPEPTPGSYPRLVVVRRQREVWAFETDEFYGLHRYFAQDCRNALTGDSPALQNFTESILPWHDRQCSYLNRDRLFEALRQQAL